MKPYKNLFDIALIGVHGIIILLFACALCAQPSTKKDIDDYLTKGPQGLIGHVAADAVQVETLDSFAKKHGKLLVSKDDAAEVVRAIKLMWGQTFPPMIINAVYQSEASRLRQMADEAEQKEKERAWALSVMDKWQKQVDEL